MRRILTNTAYNGTAYYAKHKSVGRHGRKRLQRRDRDEWIAIATLPLVDADTFAAAQAQLALNQQNRRRPAERFYLLGGLVFCADCGRVYYSQTRAGTGKQSYRHREKEGHCRNRQISARRLEPVVWAAVRDLLLEPAVLAEGYDGAHAAANAQRDVLAADLAKLERDLARHEERLAALLDAYIDPDVELSKAAYAAKRAEILADADRVRRDVIETREALAVLGVPAPLETLERFSTAVARRIGQGDPTPAQQRELFELLGVKVLIGDGDTIAIEGEGISRLTVPSIGRSARYTAVGFRLERVI